MGWAKRKLSRKIGSKVMNFRGKEVRGLKKGMSKKRELKQSK